MKVKRRKNKIVVKLERGGDISSPAPSILNILLNNPRNQPHCHVPVCINPRDHETDFILLAGHPVVIAAVGDCVDADVEADEDSALVDVRDRPGIFALDLALAQVLLAGVSVHALDVCLYGNILQGADLHA